MYNLLKQVAIRMPNGLGAGHLALRAVKMLESGKSPETVATELCAMQECWQQAAYPDRQCHCGDPFHQRHVDLCGRLCSNPNPVVVAEAAEALRTPEYMNPIQVELYLELAALICIFTEDREVLQALINLARETLPVGHVLSCRMVRTLQTMQGSGRRPQFSLN